MLTFAFFSIGNSRTTISFLTVGVVLLILGAVNEYFTTRSPIVPPRLFKVRSTPFPKPVIHILIAFSFTDTHDRDYSDHNVLARTRILLRCLLPTAILPSARSVSYSRRCRVSLVFQANLHLWPCGLIFLERMLPYSLGSAALSASSGVLVSKTGRYRPVMWAAYAVFATGMGLMIMLDAESSRWALFNVLYSLPACLSWWVYWRPSLLLSDRAEKVVFPLVAAVGLGCLFQVCQAWWV